MNIKSLLQFESCEARQQAIEAGQYADDKLDSSTEYLEACFGGSDYFQNYHNKYREKLYKKGGKELKVDYQVGERAANILRTDPFLNDKLLVADTRFVEVSGSVFGHEFEEVIPYVDNRGIIVHVKLLKSLSNQVKSPYYKDTDVSQLKDAIKRYGYDMEFWLKGRLANKKFQREHQNFLLALSKEQVPDRELVLFTEDILNEGKERLSRLLSLYDEVDTGEREPVRCEQCDYCRQTKTITGAWKFENLK